VSLDEEVDLLRNIPLFCNVEPSKLKLLAFTSKRLTFPAGQELFHQGDMGDAAYIIIDGEADVTVSTPAGEITVAKVSKNELVGEIAILCDVPRTATVRAATEVTTLAISKELFFQMVTEFPEMAVEIMRELAQRLERTTSQLREALSPSGAGDA
jgi:CRP-like cAMP-binding protein